MAFPSTIPLGVPLTNPAAWSLANEANGYQRIPRGTLIYTGGTTSVDWTCPYNSQKYRVRNESNSVTGAQWVRACTERDDQNYLPAGLFTLTGSVSATCRLFEAPIRYDGPVRIDTAAPYFRERDPGQFPYNIKLQAERLPVSWQAYCAEDSASECSPPSGVRVEVYKIPRQMHTEDVDIIPSSQNRLVALGAKLVTTISNAHAAENGYPAPIFGEYGIPTMYLDVYGWEYGSYVDVWYSYKDGVEQALVGVFEIAPPLSGITFSEEAFWVQPLIWPGGMPRDARRFPVGVTLVPMGDMRIDKTFWKSRFKHAAPHFSVLMRSPMTQTMNEYGDKLKPYKERHLTDYEANVNDGRDGMTTSSSVSKMDFVYFDRRMSNVWWSYFDGRWWAGGTNNDWLGTYLVDLFFYADFGLNYCGPSQSTKPFQQGFRLDWAYTRKPLPSWNDSTFPGLNWTDYVDFQVVQSQYDTSTLGKIERQGIGNPFMQTNARVLFE